MSKTFYARAAAVLSLVGALGLSGCAGIGTIPDTNMTDEQISPAPVQGQVLGGHAPIVGAHVYLLQPGTTGIGSQATSLLTAGYNAGGYTTSTGNSDPSVQSSWNYVTTDSTGQFNITGAYTCTANQPVYLYAYGGTPSTTPEAFSITQVVVTNPSSGGSLVTFTTSGNELFYTGEQVYPSGFTGTLAALNGSLQIIDSPATTTGAVLTTTQFSVSLGSVVTPATYTTTNFGTSAIVTGSPQSNTGIVQLAVLGNCPSSAPYTFGTGSSNKITYVYLNEVSTVAAAYAFQGFTKPSLNDATHIGSSGSTQGLVGIENAAMTAADLYNIQGSTTNISSSYDGEGHLANTVTAGGNGVVPQTVLDTLGNIIAACVDSAPNVTGTLGTNPSAQCTTLFNTATSDGTTTGTKAIDTATAAINIARHPAGVGNTSFVSTLYNLPSGDVPFTPNLTSQPNDFVVGIQYSEAGNPGISNAESIAIDNNGYVWITTQAGSGSLYYWNPQGITPTIAHTVTGLPFLNNGYFFGYVSVDPGGNAWTGASNSTHPVEEFAPLTAAPEITTPSYNSTYTIVTNYLSPTTGDAIAFGGPPSGSSCAHTYCLNVINHSTGADSPYAMTNFTGNNVAHGAIDSAGYLWLSGESNGYIDRVSQTGVEAPLFTAVNTGARPEFPSIDAYNNAVVAIQTVSKVEVISPVGGVTTLTSANTGALFYQPFGSAIDGNGNIWITNRCNTGLTSGSGTPSCPTSRSVSSGSIVQANGNSSLIELTPTYTLGVLTSAKAVSPAANYNPENEVTPHNGTATISPLLYDALNLAIDPSGNIWITDYANDNAGFGGITKIVGLAAPVVTPLSTAAGTAKFGVTP